MTSTTVRRGAPLAAGVAVLVVLAGSSFLLRDDDTAAGPGSQQPPPLRIGAASAAADGSAGTGQVTVTGDLPDGPDTAPVYRFVSGADRTPRLSDVLGVEATDVPPEELLVPQQGATLRVSTGPSSHWQFLRADASECMDQPLGGHPDDPVSSCVVPPPKQRPGPASPPSAAAAAKAAEPAFFGSGVDVDAASQGTLTSTVALDTRTLRFDPVVDDLPTTGFATTATVDEQGLLSAQGWLGDTEPGDRYPVVSAQAAVDQLAAMPMPLMACAESTPPVPPGPVCGGPLEVTAAVFGLSLQWEGERPLLVPSWLFDVHGGVQPLAVVAVDPSYLVDPAVDPGEQPSDGASGGGVPGSPGTADPGSPVAPDVQPSASTSRFDSVSPVDDGAGLVVTFYGGVDTCYEYVVTAEESADEVRLGLVEDVIGEVCIDLAQQYEKTVTLDRPLGDRRAVDAETGLSLYPVRAER